MTRVWSHDWAFLAKRFERLHANVTTKEQEDTGSAWLSLAVGEYLKSAQLGRSTQDAAMTAMKEDLLLTGSMGLAEPAREMWLTMVEKKTIGNSWMSTETRELLAPPFLHPTIAFTPRYRFLFNEGDTPRLSQWSSSFRCLFDTQAFSTPFIEHWKLMRSLFEQYGVDEAKVPTVIPIRLCFDTTEYLRPQLRYLKSVIAFVENVTKTLKENERRYPEYPRFELESIDLCCHRFDLTLPIVHEIQKLLALDVRINKLDPPSILPDDAAEHPQLWRHAWASLLLTVFGHPRAKSHPRYPITQLTTTVLEGAPESFHHALCVTIQGTKTVENLFFTDFRDETDDRSRWMAYALFSKAASECSFKFVGSGHSQLFSNCKPCDLDTIVYARYPHTQLLIDSTLAHDVDHGSVHLPRGAQVQFPYHPSDVYVVQNCDGESFQVIRMDPASRTVDILVPGYGHGLVDRGLCPNKRQRTISSSDIVPVSQARRSIQAGVSKLNIAFCDFEYFARYLGTNVRTLTLDNVWDKGEDQLAQVITQCPRLESLTVVMCGVLSLRQLIDAFANGLPLSTLRLVDLFTKDGESLLEFLRFLADPSSTIAKRLETLLLNSKAKLGVLFHLALGES